MKLTMPLLALVVAVLLVASQSLYTVDQRQYAIRFQLGEIIETQSKAGLYAKIPLMQNVKFYDKRILMLAPGHRYRRRALLIDFSCSGGSSTSTVLHR
jgi:regulator of protease activity HflC (stomatin/prohibitin superfamily)